MKECSKINHDKIRNELVNSIEYKNRVERVSNLFSLLGEPARMKIVLALMAGELCVYHICDITGGKQSATSQHLRKLRDNSVVKYRKEANQVLYSLADEHIISIINTALVHGDCEI